MFSVVTISRQIGSNGENFAKMLAETTGYDLLWREVINKAAKKIGAPGVALAMIDELGLLGLCPTPKECEAYIQAVKTVMDEHADQGKVIIVGRASQVILRGFPDTLHLRVIANHKTRITNICNEKKVNPDAALEQIKQSDAYREKYLQDFYHVDWNDPSLYDLVINTSKFEMDHLINWLTGFIVERN